MKHQIKINRALKKSKIGNFPKSADVMLEYIPEKMLDQINSSNLADMLDSLWNACQEAKVIQEKEICDQGYVWDWKQEKMRDVA